MTETTVKEKETHTGDTTAAVAEKLFTPSPEKRKLEAAQAAAIDITKRCLQETGTAAKEKWEKVVKQRVAEGAVGQTKLVMSWSKMYAESSSVHDAYVKEVAQTVWGNFNNDEAIVEAPWQNGTVTHTNLMAGKDELSGKGIQTLMTKIGGEIHPHKALNNNGEMGDEVLHGDQAVITFPHLPDVGIQINIKHPDRQKTPSDDINAIFDRRSQVTKLTAIPLQKKVQTESVWQT